MFLDQYEAHFFNTKTAQFVFIPTIHISKTRLDLGFFSDPDLKKNIDLRLDLRPWKNPFTDEYLRAIL